MRHFIYYLGIALLFPLLLCAQSEKALKEAEKELKSAEKEMRKLHRKMLRHEEEIMEEFQKNLPELERELEKIGDFDFHFEGMEAFSLEIPPIPPIEIEIPDIPEIHVDINEAVLAGLHEGLSELRHPDFEALRFDNHFHFESGFGGQRLFRNLGDEEQLRLTALRKIDRSDGEMGLKTLKKTALNDPSDALRYTAVRKLAGWIKDERVVPLLGKIANNDSSLAVRKAAIHLLGRSGDKRAVEILQDLVD